MNWVLYEVCRNSFRYYKVTEVTECQILAIKRASYMNLYNAGEKLIDEVLMLKTLDGHNRQKRDQYTQLGEMALSGNGIACPLCSNELVDFPQNVMLASMPPQYPTKCVNKECNYIGTRL